MSSSLVAVPASCSEPATGSNFSGYVSLIVFVPFCLCRACGIAEGEDALPDTPKCVGYRCACG